VTAGPADRHDGMAADELSEHAGRALAPISAQTETGRFAAPLYSITEATWRDPLAELTAAGYRIESTFGTVADEPTVTGGYRLRDPGRGEREENPGERRRGVKAELGGDVGLGL
jgi:hypothetical protein